MLVTVIDQLMGVGCQYEKKSKWTPLLCTEALRSLKMIDLIAFNGFLAKMSFPHLKAGRTAGTVAAGGG